jgi:two-component system LytT family response regulator
MLESSAPPRILIVDDEPSAREILREMLNDEVQTAAVEIIGECADGRSAVSLIQAAKPDIVFLDVQMPETDGFGVLSALSAEPLPIIIFVTAYDQYALRAFEVHALDYLLKPFDRERFDQAFKRAKTLLSQKRAGNLNDRIIALLEERNSVPAVAQSAPSPQFLERLIIKAEGRVFFLRVEEIEWIEAEGNYVALHAGKKAYLFREAISVLETRLNPLAFQRIHRSTIVNIDCIKELQPMFRGEYSVVMHDGTQLKLSHSYRGKLQKHLGGLL